MNPSIPEDFALFGTVADLSAKDDHDPASSRTTDTPPLADSCLWLLPPLPILTMWGRFGSGIGGGSGSGILSSKFSGGDPDDGEPVINFSDFCVASMGTALEYSCISDRGGLDDGRTQSGGGPTDAVAASTVPVYLE